MNRRGMVYVVAMGFVSILAILGASILARSLSETSISSRSNFQATALHFSEAAVDAAMVQLRGNNLNNLPTTPFSIGSYWAEIAPIDATTIRVTAHGLASSEQRNVEAIIRMTPKPPWDFSVFADRGIDANGNIMTDSYNSQHGVYDPHTAGNDGDIGTNATAPGGIDVRGNSMVVNGQIGVGPGVSNPASVITNSGHTSVTITGADPKVFSQPYVFPLPKVVKPAGIACQDLTIQNHEALTLSAEVGTYCFKNVDVKGTLVADGPVVVYITGDMKVDGHGEVGSELNPTALLFEIESVTGTPEHEVNHTAQIKSTSVFYGAVYGPHADVEIRDHARLFGSVVAREAKLAGSAVIHYDEALREDTRLTTQYATKLIAWQDL